MATQNSHTTPPPGFPFIPPGNNMNGVGSLNGMSSLSMNGFGHGGHSNHGPVMPPSAGGGNRIGGANGGSGGGRGDDRFLDRLESFRQSDRERDALVADIWSKYQSTLKELHEVSDDLVAERQSRRLLQERTRESDRLLEEHRREHTRTTESNPFAFVILDGDGAVFNSDLLSRGADGGAIAAHMLMTGIVNHLKGLYPSANVEDWSIMLQVVLNMEGLGKKLVACGIIDSPADLHAFAVGFNRSQHLFSVVDVGSGKERADHKVRETFRLMSRVAHCKHIYFGPCHDNGYLPFLEPYLRDSSMSNKLTLIEATPAENGFTTFARVKFESVFRTEPLPARPVAVAVASVASAAVRRGTEIAAAAAPPVAVPSVPAPAASVSSGSPPPPQSSTPAPSSWAAMSKSGDTAGKTIDIAPVKKPTRKFFILNRDHERIDEQLPAQQNSYVKKFNDRIRDKNCCNNYHLKGHCANGDGCQFQHGDRLSTGEQLVLKHKARSIKCKMGSYCEDVDCPYGHRCKFGGRECSHDDCRFFDTHHVDSRPAFRQYEDGTIESV